MFKDFEDLRERVHRVQRDQPQLGDAGDRKSRAGGRLSQSLGDRRKLPPRPTHQLSYLKRLSDAIEPPVVVKKRLHLCVLELSALLLLQAITGCGFLKPGFKEIVSYYSIQNSE